MKTLEELEALPWVPDDDDGYVPKARFSLGDNLNRSEMVVRHYDRAYNWYIFLATRGGWYEVNGYNCATVEKAKRMAIRTMHSLLTSVQEVKPNAND